MSQRVDEKPVLEVSELRKVFVRRGMFARASGQTVPAVDGVSFSLRKGSSTGLVGESGCGKSTLSRLIAHLHTADSGTIRLLGKEVQSLGDAGFRPYRRSVQMVFQNPLRSFDPSYTLGSSIGEVLRLRAVDDPQARITELLGECGLSPRFANLRPKDVSGGELQRAAIARALAAMPELVVMDEPTSALDMSIQGQVLKLLQSLQQEHELTYLIATHDLHVVERICDDVLVMYLGQVVEAGPVTEVFTNPRHPYTRGLLYAHDLAARTPERDRTERIRGTLEYPEPGYQGCRLVGRCPMEAEGCRSPQALTELSAEHHVRCWRATEPARVADAAAS
jgi:peptide/nickel transport system ATP-binding protein